MTTTSGTDTVAAFTRAFRAQNRDAADALMSADFEFTSPQDDHIDKATWLERCFPTADHFDEPSTTLELLESDGLVFHRYEYSVDGVRYRNVEASRLEDGKVREVEVYFGGKV